MIKHTVLDSRILWRQVVLLTVLSLAALFVQPAWPQGALNLAGELWVSGAVEVNGKAAVTGMTVFTGYKIIVKQGGAATVNLGKNIGTMRLQPGTEMTLNLAPTTLGGELTKGRITLLTPANVAIKVATAAGTVTSRERLASVFTIEADAEKTSLCVEKGRAMLRTTQQPEQANEGEALLANIALNVQRLRCNAGGVVANGGGAGGAGGGAGGAGGGGGAGGASGAGGVAAVIAVGAAGAAVPLIVNAAAGPPTAGGPGDPTVTPTRPTPLARICDCRFNTFSGRILNPRQAVTICHQAATGSGATQAITCANLLDHFNPDGTPRPGHERDSCGACASN